MKNFDLDKYRQENVELLLYGGSGVGTNNGVFIIPYQGRNLAVIASDGDGWEHVSVSLPNRFLTGRKCVLLKIFSGTITRSLSKYIRPKVIMSIIIRIVCTSGSVKKIIGLSYRLALW